MESVFQLSQLYIKNSHIWPFFSAEKILCLQIIYDKTPAFCLKKEIELALFLIPLAFVGIRIAIWWYHG